MTEPLRIDLVRRAEAELREAFARGEFDQELRVYVAALERVRDLVTADNMRAISRPGPERDRFCVSLARRWAAFPEAERLGSITAFLHDGLNLQDIPLEHRQAAVVSLRPQPCETAPAAKAPLILRDLPPAPNGLVPKRSALLEALSSGLVSQLIACVRGGSGKETS